MGACVYTCVCMLCVLCICVSVVKVGAGKALCFCVTPWIHLEPTGKLLSPQTLLWRRNTTKWPWLVDRISFFSCFYFSFPMASGPITSWEIDGETVETVADFILGSSKITANGDCSHEIKRHLLLGRKVMTNLLLLLLLLSRFSRVRLCVTP